LRSISTGFIALMKRLTDPVPAPSSTILGRACIAVAPFEPLRNPSRAALRVAAPILSPSEARRRRKGADVQRVAEECPDEAQPIARLPGSHTGLSTGSILVWTRRCSRKFGDRVVFTGVAARTSGRAV
jgi:hypothetical protein